MGREPIVSIVQERPAETHMGVPEHASPTIRADRATGAEDAVPVQQAAPASTGGH